MKMREYPPKLVAANHKMNLNLDQEISFCEKLTNIVSRDNDTEIIIAPSFFALAPLREYGFSLAAQNCCPEDAGAFTGEVSAAQLKTLAQYVLVGHSERRHIFHETNDVVAQKFVSTLKNDLRPILCIGETAEDRAQNLTENTLRGQIESCLKDVDENMLTGMVIAYEPVWAIGSGASDSVDDVVDIVGKIREVLSTLIDAGKMSNVRILYGGSVKPENATSFARVTDGLLVGGASNTVTEFATIVEKVQQTARGVALHER